MDEMNISVCKYKDAVLIIKSEKEESCLYYENPVTGKWYKEIEDAFKGWIEEQDESERDEWNMLKKFIREDKKLYSKIEDKIELIEYI